MRIDGLIEKIYPEIKLFIESIEVRNELNYLYSKTLNHIPVYIFEIMKPTIKTSKKGEITIQNNIISQDFYINVEGQILNRKRESSLTSPMNVLTLHEAGVLYDPNINEMIIGCVEHDKLKLSNEAYDFLEEKRCKIKLLPIDEAITYWNRYEGHAVGLFHIQK